VPGTHSSLEKESARSAKVRVVYSALDSIRLAKLNPNKKFIFLAVGFETTAPTIALSVILARKEKLKNLFFLNSLRLIPPVMGSLLSDKRLNLQGFLCPGHVSCIIGTRAFEFIPKKHRIGCCIAGFEPLDILEGLYFLILQIASGKARVDNQYTRLVKREGNPRAKRLMLRVFEVFDASWRGLGRISLSGLNLREEYAAFDAQRKFNIQDREKPIGERTKCKCALVLRGLLSPPGCPLFAKGCTPLEPLGPCMVSSEGACNAYYRYR
jgi:hydrogenase expression/formation protein HypD